MRVLVKANGGKFDALNHGIAHARGEIVVCIDGDSIIERDALRYLVAHFDDPSVGAVAGNVRVANRATIWSGLQALEYVVGLGLAKRAQSAGGAVTIVPGPAGAFRKTALAEVNAYDGDTFAEDFDLTMKLLEAGWHVVYEPRAIVLTEAPERTLDLLRQRYRWTRGSLQVLPRAAHLPGRMPWPLVPRVRSARPAAVACRRAAPLHRRRPGARPARARPLLVAATALPRLRYGALLRLRGRRSAASCAPRAVLPRVLSHRARRGAALRCLRRARAGANELGQARTPRSARAGELTMQSIFIFLSNLVLFLSLATLVFAIGACITMVLKRRQPQRRKREAPPADAAQLLRRYVPPDPD